MFAYLVTANMELVLNETTKTVHKHETSAATLHTECGVTHNLDPDRLELITDDSPVTDHDAQKCGRCFEDGGGY